MISCCDVSDSKHIMMIAGEPSGDFHGACLLKEIKKTDPCVRFTGIGGDLMKNQGMELFFHMEKMSVMGITEVISKIGVIKRAFTAFRKTIISDRPDLLIVIDYPGFNLKAAAFASLRSIPVLYYITPKVWAWNKSRIKKIKKYVSHAALIFPFEEPIFRREKIPASFVGNPLLDYYTDEMLDKNFNVNISRENREKNNNEFVIGLLPGSRETEIAHLFKIMLESAVIIYNKTGGRVRFLVSMADSVNSDNFNSIFEKYIDYGFFDIVKGHPVSIFKKADLLVAASGTVTLEAAICGIPMIIVYKMSYISYLLAKSFVKVKYAGLANIIAGREIVPELLQNDANSEKIAETVLSLLSKNKLYMMKNRLFMVRKMLGGSGASERTAKIALSMLGPR